MTVRLTKLQEEVVGHNDGALLVLAGPGSGKTRVLTERVRRLLAQPQQHYKVLALTFTNKAANEMVERLQDVPNIRERAFVGTLHSFCMEVLANRGKTVGIDVLPHIYESFEDRKEILLTAIRKDHILYGLLSAGRDPKQQNILLGQWLRKIAEQKNKLLFAELIDDEDARKIYEAYNAELRSSQAVDYDDLLLLTWRLFQERPHIADFYRRQYKYVCVDEGQDLNEAQYQLLQALCGTEYKNIMIVGDPKQAIYVFNGANPKYLDNFKKDFAAKAITLTENFRSSQLVVKAAQSLDPTYHLDGQLPIQGAIVIQQSDDEEDESKFVSKTIELLLQQGHPDVEGTITLNRIAVLGRNRFVFSEIEKQLQHKGLQYYKKLSMDTYESMSELVEQFELALKVLSNPMDRLHLGILLKTWGIKKTADQFLSATPRTDSFGRDMLRSAVDQAHSESSAIVIGAIEALNWTTENFTLHKGLDYLESAAQSMKEDERELVMKDVAEWRKHWEYYLRSQSGGYHSVPSFLAQVALGTTQSPTQDGIALMTYSFCQGNGI